MSVMTEQSSTQVIAEGSVATIIAVVAHNTFFAMLPYMIVCLCIIILDLYYGIRAARKRGEEIRVSRAARRTIAKTFEYLCWLLIGAGLAVAFDAPWLDKTIVGAVLGIECISMFSNALYCKGYKIKGLDKALIKKIGQKEGIDTTDIEIIKEGAEEETTTPHKEENKKVH